MENTYPSQLLEKAVTEFSKLPGIGRKTASCFICCARVWTMSRDSPVHCRRCVMM